MGRAACARAGVGDVDTEWKKPAFDKKSKIEKRLYQEQQQQLLVGFLPKLDDDARVQFVKCAVFRGSS